MAETPIVISEHQFLKLKSVLARTCVECAARVVLLVDRDGHPIAFHGDIAGMDTTSFSSLAAGNVAATTSMAKLIGENVFRQSFTKANAKAFSSASSAEVCWLSFSTSVRLSAWLKSEPSGRAMKLPRF